MLLGTVMSKLCILYGNKFYHLFLTGFLMPLLASTSHHWLFSFWTKESLEVTFTTADKASQLRLTFTRFIVSIMFTLLFWILLELFRLSARSSFGVGSKFIVIMKFMVQTSDHFNKLFTYNVMFSMLLLGSVPEIEIGTTQGSHIKVKVV